MSRTFNNLADLEKFLNKQMVDVLNKEVAQKVKNIEQEKVITEVYDTYSPSTEDGEPWVYKRRGWQGGLADQKNMKHQVNRNDNGVELIVENETEGKSQVFKIAELVEYGDKYNGKEYEYKSNRDGTSWQYLQPRPFTQSTVEELERTGEHINEMKKGLRSRGLDVE